MYSNVQTFGDSKFFFIQQVCIKLVKSDSKDIYNITKV